MDHALFRRFRDLAHEKAGIALGDSKKALVAARIGRRMRCLGLNSSREYIEHIEVDPSGEELVHFLDAISTNFTSFFREPDHFELLADEVKGLVASGQKRLRFWSAASSSGQEPYSMAITLLESVHRAAANIKILATDISTRALAQATAGVYDATKVDSVPGPLRTKYFTLHGEHTSGQRMYRIRPEVRELVVFARLNLSRPPFPMKGPFDAVFCRNVMIYFDRPVRQGLVDDIARLLRPDGLLAIGHSETLHGVESGMRCVHASVYRKGAGSVVAAPSA